MGARVNLYVVRHYDRFDGFWTDVSTYVTQTEANRIWNEKTNNGTCKTKYEDHEYYKVFPANTTMLFKG